MERIKEMKTLLVAVNSQYVHSNLAVRYLKAACDESCGAVKVLEFTINDTLMHIFSSIVREAPDIVAFSCYIWNIEHIVKLAGDLKEWNPNVILIAGGPEVSFDQGGLLENRVDYLIAGEGEEKLPFLLRRLSSGEPISETEIDWFGRFTTIEKLELLPSPYASDLPLENRIAYFEASRGCPFRCGYCISSVTGGVRYFPLEKVYAALDTLAGSGSRIIKFVDRTFNANEQRSVEIWNYLLRYQHQGIVFHFEIDPGLLSETMLDCLEKMPAGLIQLEAGIQSVHPETLEAVRRPWKIEKAFASLRRVISFGNIHVHVDLIAGLPNETYSKFRESFNLAMGLHAHHCQLGFLKLLRGSPLRRQAQQWGYRYRSYPPYEVISSRDLSSQEMIRLKDMEACVELFYNSGRFSFTLQYLKKQPETMEPFTFYETLAVFMRSRGYLDRPVKAAELYGILYDFLREINPSVSEGIFEYMRLDYLRSFRNPAVPAILRSNAGVDPSRNKRKKIEQYRSVLERTLPRLRNQTLDSIWQQIHIENFNFPAGLEFPRKAVIAVDFADVSPVTGLAGMYLLDSLRMGYTPGF